jgi:hypothetical protein
MPGIGGLEATKKTITNKPRYKNHCRYCLWWQYLPDKANASWCCWLRH